MNREIKFRAFNKKEKIMETVCVTPDGVGFYDHVAKDVHEYVRGIFSDPMQYTGLRDKNGVEIYEGDIIRFDYNHDSLPGEVFWLDEQACFYHRSKSHVSGICASIEDYEIIGNIYENPELLEVSTNE